MVTNYGFADICGDDNGGTAASAAKAESPVTPNLKVVASAPVGSGKKADNREVPPEAKPEMKKDDEIYRSLRSKTDFGDTEIAATIQKFLAPMEAIPNTLISADLKLKMAVLQAKAQAGLSDQDITSAFDGLESVLQKEQDDFKRVAEDFQLEEIMARQEHIAEISVQLAQLQEAFTRVSAELAEAQKKAAEREARFMAAVQRRRGELTRERADYRSDGVEAVSPALALVDPPSASQPTAPLAEHAEEPVPVSPITNSDAEDCLDEQQEDADGSPSPKGARLPASLMMAASGLSRSIRRLQAKNEELAERVQPQESKAEGEGQSSHSATGTERKSSGSPSPAPGRKESNSNGRAEKSAPAGEASTPANAAATSTSSSTVPPRAVRKVAPTFPQLAARMHVEGKVVLSAVVLKDGTVGDITVVSGPQLLQGAAIDALKQWTYKPALSDGEPVQSSTVVAMSFSRPTAG